MKSQMKGSAKSPAMSQTVLRRVHLGSRRLSCEMIVLGSQVAAPGAAANKAEVAHRKKCAWRTWAGVSAQLRQRGTPFTIRLKLLEMVVLHSLLWGLETQFKQGASPRPHSPSAGYGETHPPACAAARRTCASLLL